MTKPPGRTTRIIFADDAQRVGDVNQQIATEHHVERRVRKQQLGRIALLEPCAWRVLRPRLRVVDETGVVLDANALTWFKRGGETAGGVSLSAPEIQNMRAGNSRKVRQHSSRRRLEKLRE